MLHSGFLAAWHSGWRGKCLAVGFVALVALASVMGWFAERRMRARRG